MDRDHREQRDHEHEEHKIGMDFRGLAQHMSADHSRDADTDVNLNYYL